MSVINVFDFELVEGKKIQRTPYLIEAIRRLKAKNNFKIEENEDVIDLGKLILMMHKLAIEVEGRRNTNYSEV